MRLKYNYVFFNSSGITNYSEDTNGYAHICAKDLSGLKEAINVPFPLYHKGKLMTFLFLLHRSRRLNQYIDIPFKSIWYPYFFKNTFLDSKPLCFVIQNRLFITVDYLSYLKKRYPSARFVMIHRDLMKFCKNGCAPGLIGNPILDFEMSYDEGECAEYGMVHFDEFESKIDIPISDKYPMCDLYFAGRAKDRLPALRKTYDVITKAGLTCHYYLTGVPEIDRITAEGIKYADINISYYEMLFNTINARCILEYNQGGALGYTSRFLEAVMYNKKLITNNETVLKSKFYNPKYIQVIKRPEDISIDFILDDSYPVNYNYDNEFSPIHLLETIDKELVRRYGI